MYALYGHTAGDLQSKVLQINTHGKRLDTLPPKGEQMSASPMAHKESH